MEIWRADVNQKTVFREAAPAHWDGLGGRGLLAQILLDEVPADCDPLGADNRLIFSPGLLVGHRLSSCDRISIGAKSPLTGGVKESNAGGSTGYQLASLGIRALIIQGAPEISQGWKVLHLSTQGGRFENADDLQGSGVMETARLLRERYGEKAAIALIGPGGEMRLRAAGIQNLNREGVPSRIAARGGLGAVMASKGLKAVVIDAEGAGKPPIAHPEAFRAAQKAYHQALLDHPQTAVYADYGTSAVVQITNTIGCLPTRNFSVGQFEGAQAISGDMLRKTILERGGKGDPSHACMAGCVIRCSNVYAGEDGQTLVTPLEYETIGLMGSNLGIADLDAIARMNHELNDLGLDSIEIGAALGVAAEAGLWRFGDAERAWALLQEIRSGSELGRMLGSGAAVTGRTLGVKRVPVVKGQALAAYDPRALRVMGVTYATTPQGADHTAGTTLRAKTDPIRPEGQVEASRTVQLNAAGYDCLGACIFAGFGFAAAPHTIPDLLNARYGWQVGADILQALGRRTIDLEREFNRRAGFTSADDRLPKWMTEEPLAPHNTVFDVSDSEMDRIFSDQPL